MNRLAGETSPYLRQHRDNPVDWYPWGPEAFRAAADREVPILLSVGYSACHWCHVMAHECFEDDEVAARMNELFVNVKVDREERPDVDAVYMDAVQAMTGRGGWPMTVFLDPRGRPFYGGTYFPRDTFLQLLATIDEVYRTRPEDIEQNVTALVHAIGATARIEPADDLPGPEELNAAVQGLARAFDPEWGGFGRAPKFPAPLDLQLMLRAHMATGGDLAAEIVRTSLDAMAAGGIYDHLGGGFARYSVDREWLVPHFEKMLPDQAMLVRTYLQAMLVLRVPHFQQVVEETVGYVLGTLRHPGGGFFSAEDADSPGEDGRSEEGRFSTWTPAEVRSALDGTPSDVVDELLAWYDITEAGNFEGRSVPNRRHHRGELLRPPDVADAHRRLYEARERRPRPGLDDKILTEWNALFLSSLAEAAAIMGRADWLEAAIANGEFLLAELRGADGRWRRSWQADGDPPARHEALAGDLAALVDAFTRLAEASGQARWIAAAVDAADRLLDGFFDPVDGGLFTTAEDGEQLVVRRKDLVDGASPSANSLGATALLRLAALTGERRFANHADRILQLVAGRIRSTDGPLPMVSGALLAADLRRRGITEVVVVGDRPDLVRAAQAVWRPDAVLAWGEPYDSPLWEGRDPGYAYVCRDAACRLPEDSVEGLLGQLVTTDPGG